MGKENGKNTKKKSSEFSGMQRKELIGIIDRLRLENSELENIESLMNEYNSNITHEMRSPLVAIMGYSEMLLDGDLGRLNTSQSRALKIMIRNISRLLDLIDQILRFHRLSEASVNRRWKPFDLAQLIRNVRRNFEPAMKNKEIFFHSRLPDAKILVTGDKPRIERVFTNLVSNAVKFTPNGGTISICVEAAKDGFATIRVEDTGCGIPASAQRYIFDRYRQTDGSVRRRFGGTGLGLAIVRCILNAHGVDISVRSKPGKGSIFTFDLPVIEMENASSKNAVRKN